MPTAQIWPAAIPFLRRGANETRSPERLRAHFEIETRLAARLRAASREERANLYTAIYEELFAELPDHPQHRADRAVRVARIARQVAMLRRDAGAGAPANGVVYVELGCGDAALTRALAPHVGEAVGVDVTDALQGDGAPPNFRFLLSDGVHIDLPSASVDLVYSYQLMEHLHVDDALDQLQEIHRVLRPGGRYLCSTPNRLSGPHDISGYFTHQAMGLHLHEYDHRELAHLLRAAGFRRLLARVFLKGRIIDMPVGPACVAESLIGCLPHPWRARLFANPRLAGLAGVNLIGIK